VTMVKPCYPTLEAKIAEKGMVKKELADGMNITPRTFSLKLTGKTKFILPEVLYLHSFFPELSIEELFRTDSESEVE